MVQFNRYESIWGWGILSFDQPRLRNVYDYTDMVESGEEIVLRRENQMTDDIVIILF